MKISSRRKKWISVVSLSLFLAGCLRYSLKGRTPADQDYLERARKFPLEFNIPKAEEYNTWGRAQSFIGKYSPMRIQVVSDFVIHTFNPAKDKYGFYIVKTPLADSVQISVKCVPGDFVSNEIALDYAHICAYYVKTGLLPPVGLVKVYEEEKPDLPFPLWSFFLGVAVVATVGYILLHSLVYD